MSAKLFRSPCATFLPQRQALDGVYLQAAQCLGITELGKSRLGDAPEQPRLLPQQTPPAGRESPAASGRQQPVTPSPPSLSIPSFFLQKHFLSGTRTSHPPAPRFWPPDSKAQWPGSAHPRLDPAVNLMPRGSGSLPGCPGRSTRSHGRGAASYMPHPLRWNPATGDDGGDPAAPRLPTQPKGQELGAAGLGHASHPTLCTARVWCVEIRLLAFFRILLPSCRAETLLVVVVGIYGPVYLISGEPGLISEAAREGLRWTAR